MKSKDYAIKNHEQICQTYDGRSYGFHLELSGFVFDHFRHLLDMSEETITSIQDAVFLHDLLEDAWHISYNTLKTEFGTKTAEIVYLVSEEKGRTRNERHNSKYLNGVASMDEAIFVKLCDNIANVLASGYSNNSMYNKYKQEYAKLRSYIFKDRFKSMFDLLEYIYATDLMDIKWQIIIEDLYLKYPKKG